LKFNITQENFRKAFGWSWRLYTHTLLKLNHKLLNDIFNNNGVVLEVGTSTFSQLGTIFKNATRIDLGFFSRSPKQKAKIKKFLEREFNSLINIKVKECNFEKIEGKYNIIIMKSVLGGIYREKNSSLKDVQSGIENVIKNNLVHGGYLVTLDNGKGLIHKFSKNFGTRKINWRFFNSESLKNKYMVGQATFGLFSIFTLQSRIPLIGSFLDSIIYYIDRIFFPLSSCFFSDGSAIVTVYKNKIDFLN
tara:strand:+ start:216 stop:959 length:744 start_codon:yes stop_codon:yes gene_type:complete